MFEEDDYKFALQLQTQFDSEFVNDITKFEKFSLNFQKQNFETTGSHDESLQTEECNLANESMELIDPTPDVWSLFVQFDKKFFNARLAGVEVSWSKRMTSCAGICEYKGRRSGHCSIRLSEPLLKLRPRKDLLETLLHEMIHAYLFVTHNNKDREGHGEEFKGHMRRINKATNLNITIYHSFHREVALYQQHWWRCDGVCQQRPPYFGLVKRSMDRAPGPRDFWWGDHVARCGGCFVKIKEPENHKNKNNKNNNNPHAPEVHNKSNNNKINNKNNKVNNNKNIYNDHVNTLGKYFSVAISPINHDKNNPAKYCNNNHNNNYDDIIELSDDDSVFFGHNNKNKNNNNNNNNNNKENINNVNKHTTSHNIGDVIFGMYHGPNRLLKDLNSERRKRKRDDDDDLCHNSNNKKSNNNNNNNKSNDNNNNNNNNKSNNSNNEKSNNNNNKKSNNNKNKKSNNSNNEKSNNNNNSENSNNNNASSTDGVADNSTSKISSFCKSSFSNSSSSSSLVACPICDTRVFLSHINLHIDEIHVVGGW